jgi:hypothetical protein
MVLMRSTGAQNLTIPDGMKVGSTFMVTQDSTGTTTLVLDGVSADNASGTLTCSQDEAVTIYYKDVDNVIIYKSGPVDYVPASSSTVLSDGSAITITGQLHTLTSSEAAITWTDSYLGAFTDIDIILNATSATYTFPSGYLTVSDGFASGSNVLTIAGVSGDNYHLSISRNGSVNKVIIKNFGQ